MVTSSKRPDQWIFPGGGVEPEEDSSVTAIREVAEEAGVTGKLDRFLGIFEVRVSIIPIYFYLIQFKVSKKDLVLSKYFCCNI